MKKNPVFQAARERMEPGRLSRDGFLGVDERSIEDIVAADVAVLEQEGVTADELADFLDDVHVAADAALEAPRRLYGGRLTVQLVEVMGRISCPFACGFRTHKANIQITAAGQTVTVTPMQAHLIRDHGFFQGRGGEFRVEPQELVALYRLAMG